MKVNIGMTLIELRKRKHFTQQQVCLFLNVSRPTYSCWENNIGDVPFSKILILMNAYKISVVDFFDMLKESNISIPITIITDV